MLTRRPVFNRPFCFLWVGKYQYQSASVQLLQVEFFITKSLLAVLLVI